MKDWEEQNRLLRIEKEKTMQKRKQETERRLRELQDMVEEKRKEREEKLEILRNRKVYYLSLFFPLLPLSPPFLLARYPNSHWSTNNITGSCFGSRAQGFG
jgi:hypothetical protein